MVWNEEVYVVGDDNPKDPCNDDKTIVRLNVRTFDPLQAHRHCMFSSLPAYEIWEELNNLITAHGDERRIKEGPLRVTIEAKRQVAEQAERELDFDRVKI